MTYGKQIGNQGNVRILFTFWQYLQFHSSFPVLNLIRPAVKSRDLSPHGSDGMDRGGDFVEIHCQKN